MRTILQKSSYERLIGQTVYIEENLKSIQETLLSSKLITSRNVIDCYFKKYIRKVEALFETITVVDDKETRLSSIPFIVLDSSFTLADSNNRVYYCHMTYDNTWDENRSIHQIHFLSETGLKLLLKEEGAKATVNMGSGYMEHKIRSIRIEGGRDENCICVRS